MTRNFLIGISLLFALASNAAAQRSDIRGVVTDSASGENIPYATVSVVGTNRGAVTNNNGFYLIANLPEGKYTITANSIGYDELSKQITVKTGQPQTVNFRLQSAPVEVNEVVITGGRKTEIEEISTSVHVMSQQELKKVPVTAQDDLLRSIQIIPGIVTSADVSSKFYVRGGAGDQNLIYLDGMKIYNPYHAFGIFSIFDPDFVKNTEVYTGAFPAGYGGRLSSVVNIVSRNGNNQQITGSAGINFISGKLLLEGPLSKNNTWILNARKSLFNDTFKKFLREPAPISFYDIFAKVNFGGADYGRQSIQTFLSGDDIIAPSPTEADHRWRMSSYALTFSDLVDERIYVDAVLYGSSFSIVRDAKQSTAVRDAESYIRDGGIRGELTMYSESKDLYFIGFEVNIPSYLYKFSSPSNLNVEVKDVSVESWGWFRYQLNYDRVKADLGIHSDLISLFDAKYPDAILQPRMNISYLFDSGWRGKVSFGVYSQNLITLTNEDDVISLFEAWIYTPPNTRPEIAKHYVAGMEGNIFSELSLNVQIYLKDYSSLVLYNREKKYAIDPDYINGKGKAYGIETLFRYKYSFLDLYVAYTLGWTSLTINSFTYAPRYDRRHNLNILNVARITESIDVGVRWEFGSGYPFTQTVSFYDRLTLGGIGRTPVTSETGKPYSVLGEKNASRLPAYHRMDLFASYTFDVGSSSGSVGLSLSNVYDNDNILFYDRKTLQKITMLPFLPSASLKVNF